MSKTQTLIFPHSVGNRTPYCGVSFPTMWGKYGRAKGICDFRQKRDKHPMSFTSLTAYQLSDVLTFREPAHYIRQLMVATTVTTS